jgi:hypothetical protein
VSVSPLLRNRLPICLACHIRQLNLSLCLIITAPTTHRSLRRSNQTWTSAPAHPATSTEANFAADSKNDPIRVAAKGKNGKKRKNVFFDDRGFPDQSDEFDYLLHQTGGVKIFCKRLHPKFHFPFDEAKHGEKLRKELKTDHLPANVQKKLINRIKKYWTIFDERGLFVPVRDYECVIDTGLARPISVSNINYGPRKTPIMQKCIAALEKLGQIEQTHSGQWLFKALLAPKPHQEHVTKTSTTSSGDFV